MTGPPKAARQPTKHRESWTRGRHVGGSHEGKANSDKDVNAAA